MTEYRVQFWCDSDHTQTWRHRAVYSLTREGQTAWPGDGTSCVEQMIRLQWERAEKAEAALSSLRSSSLGEPK